MTRFKKTPLEQKKDWRRGEYYEGPSGKRLSDEELTQAQRINSMANDAEQYLPKGLKGNAAAEALVDAAVTAKYLASDPRTYMAAGGAAALGLAGAGLQAHYDQQRDYLPTGPLSVAGRMVNNLNPFNNGDSLNTAGAVGIDPLAAARNNINEARQIVGTENMLQALAADEVMQMRSENKALESAMAPVEDDVTRLTRDMVDARARELMQEPIQYSDGSVRNMRYDEALRFAQEQVNMELRAHDVY